MHNTIWSGLFTPLFGFLFLLICGQQLSRKAVSIIGSLAIFISFISFSVLLYAHAADGAAPLTFTLFKWIPVQGIDADFSLRLDSLSLLMTLIITGVGFLIHVYSAGYMDHDQDIARFFACLNFFVFAMLLLVLSSNLLLLFVGWEGVGLASYLLIGFWYQRPSAAQAATKAFVVNRVGDWGFLVGLLLTFTLFGTSDIAQISSRAVQEYPMGAPLIVLLTLLLFFGATGKSAQIPLQTWLPDAMEGPTPVSALIHAATMVTAGVYLVVRLHPIFVHAPATIQLVGVVGGVTALYAALCACGQTDLKRVLAYSTVSQLGLMFLACGAGAFYAAMFHLTTHAFVKALLFLSAGNVVHMMHGNTEMEKMGGLGTIFTKTRWLFLIGVLSMAGVPPLAIFFSKDLILEQEHLAGFETLFYIGLAASVLTAFYLTRAYCLAFTGKPKMPPAELSEVHEAPRVMLLPVAILAMLTLAGGFLGFAFGKQPLLESFLAEVGVNLVDNLPSDDFVFTIETLFSVIGALIGVGVGGFIYMEMQDRLPSKPFALLKKAFFIDQIYAALFAVPLKNLSRLIANRVEPTVFDGSIVAVENGTQSLAQGLQKIQSGQIRSYIAWMAVGLALLILYLAL